MKTDLWVVQVEAFSDGYQVLVRMTENEAARLRAWLIKLRDETGITGSVQVTPTAGMLTFNQYVKAVEKYAGKGRRIGSAERPRDLGTTHPPILERMIARSFGPSATGEQVQRVGEIMYELLSEDGKHISDLSKSEMQSYLNKANYAYGQELSRVKRNGSYFSRPRPRYKVITRTYYKDAANDLHCLKHTPIPQRGVWEVYRMKEQPHHRTCLECCGEKPGLPGGF
jgi:hypothetical protein